jgi:2,6-dihydroxypseudooxynicotine hydrolase
MSSDPLVKSAVSHWGPRFVGSGVTYADFQEVMATIATWDDWCAAWSKRAAVHEALGREALAGKHLFSAGEHLQRAGVYYHFAAFLFVHDQAQMRAAHTRAIACRNDALPHIRPAGERVEIPYEGRNLVGILRKPEGVARPPVIAMALGLDSHKEESDAHEQPYLQRGMATLVFEGPGQGECQYDLPIRGDYEVPFAAVLDYIETRKDLDSNRVALWGVSLGGYYAPRAAAFDKRAKACIALGGPFDMAACFDGLPELTRETFRVRSKSATREEAKRKAATLTLEGIGQNITCPIYIMNGRNDTLLPAADAERLAREVKGPVFLNIIENGNHVASNRAYCWRAQSADWVAEQLRG